MTIKHINFNKEAPDSGYWDQTMILDILKTIDHEHKKIFIIPSRQNAKYINKINETIKNQNPDLIIFTGDEENDLNPELIKSTCPIYYMTPLKKYCNVDLNLPNGYSPAVNYRKQNIDKNVNSLFIGQNNTELRQKTLKEFKKNINKPYIHVTEGFAKGMNQKTYFNYLQRSKTGIAPNGTITPDTFRIYELLEAQAVPVVYKSDYWNMLFDFSLPTIKNESELNGTINFFIDTFPKYNNKFTSLWKSYKIKLKERIMKDLKIKPKSNISVLITTSYINSHPSTKIIQETINSVKQKLPNSKIIIMADNSDQDNSDYQQYLFNLHKKYIKDLNIQIKLFKEHNHQSGMTKKVLNEIDTELILFVEHDTPICEEIPFDILENGITNNVFNVIRLHHEALILKVHKHLMIGDVFANDNINNKKHKFIKTIQWSQRPHISSTKFYKKILDKYFKTNKPEFIEDIMHGVVHTAYKKQGLQGWNKFKVGIYAPDGDMKRSYHLDGKNS